MSRDVFPGSKARGSQKQTDRVNQTNQSGAVARFAESWIIRLRGAMAQLGARLHGMQKVASSSLAGSIRFQRVSEESLSFPSEA